MSTGSSRRASARARGEWGDGIAAGVETLPPAGEGGPRLWGPGSAPPPGRRHSSPGNQSHAPRLSARVRRPSKLWPRTRRCNTRGLGTHAHSFPTHRGVCPRPGRPRAAPFRCIAARSGTCRCPGWRPAAAPGTLGSPRQAARRARRGRPCRLPGPDRTPRAAAATARAKRKSGRPPSGRPGAPSACAMPDAGRRAHGGAGSTAGRAGRAGAP